MMNTNLQQHAGNMVKTVLPKGDILNDRGMNVDHLGHSVYAKALARQIQRIKTPITVGVYSRWGSGKTFLLKHVQSLVAVGKKITEEQEKQNQKKSLEDQVFEFLTTLLLVLVFLVSLILMILFRTKVIHVPNLQVVLVILLIIFLLDIFWIILNFGKKCLNDDWWKYGPVIFSALFIKLPIEESDVATVQTTFSERTSLRLQTTKTHSQNSPQDSQKLILKKVPTKSRRFIFVNFNAWEYAGSDVLWAGIIATLVEKVEDEFGMFTTRLFRSLTLEKTTKDQLFQEFKQILIKISHDCSKNEIYNLMLEYGAVIYCNKYSEWKILRKCKKNSNEKNESWWVVKFAKPSEAKYASKAMKCFGFEVCYINDSNETIEIEKRFSMWEQFWKYPRSRCKVPNWVWCCLFILGCIIVPVVTFMFINSTEKSKKKGQETGNDIGIVLSFLPAALGVAFSVFKTVWAILHSQQSRINKALKGVKENVKNELGFMNKVKNEVNSVVDLIHTVEFTTGLKYKIIVTIDDLDRVPLPKVKAVLEAVNILLSQQYSPFICLIAIDSRIAVKCFETIGEGVEGQRDSTINGYEYLKKIINLPFCLPEIDSDSKTAYIEGLIDEADDTEETFVRMCNINVSSRDTADESNEELASQVSEACEVNEEIASEVSGTSDGKAEGQPEEKVQEVFEGNDGQGTTRMMMGARRMDMFAKSVENGSKPDTRSLSALDEVLDVSNVYTMQRKKLRSPSLPSYRRASPPGASALYIMKRKRLKSPFAEKRLNTSPSIDITDIATDEETQERDEVAFASKESAEDIQLLPLTLRAEENQSDFLEQSDLSDADAKLHTKDDDNVTASIKYPMKDNESMPQERPEVAFASKESAEDIQRAPLTRHDDNVTDSNEHAMDDYESMPQDQAHTESSTKPVIEDKKLVSTTTKKNKVKKKEIEAKIAKTPSLLSQRDFDEFLFNCRLFMHQNDTVKNHLYGNPRNIKRIFNVISIIASVMQCDQERKQQFKNWMTFVNENHKDNSSVSPSDLSDSDGQDSQTGENSGSASTDQDNSVRKQLAELLVLWVVLTDQWPFRMSYIVQVMEDADQRESVSKTDDGISDSVTISNIYIQKVRKTLAEKDSTESFQHLMKLDSDESRLNSLLLKSKQLTKGKVKQLIKFSINLDGNLKQTICYQMDKANMEQ